jgi:hypothetical protein
MTDKYDSEGVEDGSRPGNAGTPSHFRGPRAQGLQVFGWYGTSRNGRPMQRFTITRAFHGPRRTGL